MRLHSVRFWGCSDTVWMGVEGRREWIPHRLYQDERVKCTENTDRASWIVTNSSVIVYPVVCIKVGLYIYIYMSGEGWLRNPGMQSMMQASHPGGEEKLETYLASLENYLLPPQSVIMIWTNFKMRKYISTNRRRFRLETSIYWNWYPRPK